MVKNLLVKHKIFIFEWMKEPTCLVSAMRRAGYSGNPDYLERKAHEILNHKDALAITSKFLNSEEVKQQVKISIQSVLEDLQLAKQYSLEVFYDAQGNQRRELTSFLRAVELQGKHLKMFADRVSVEVDGHAELVGLIRKRMIDDE